MAINFPKFETIDVGRAVREGQQIKENRLRNQILGSEVEERQNILQNRQKAQQIREQLDSMPEQIEAMEQAGLHDQAAELRNSYVDTRLNEVQILETLRDSIDETNYKQFRQDMIQAGAIEGSMLPTEYSEDWFRESIEENRGKLETFTRRWGEQGAIFAQDMVQQDGSILWEGDPYETDASQRERRLGAEAGGDGKPFEMAAADSNAISRGAAELYGGRYNPQTGEWSALDRETAQEAATLSEEASRIYREQRGRIGHREALAQAARRQGIRLDNIQMRMRNDPNDVGTDFRSNPDPRRPFGEPPRSR